MKTGCLEAVGAAGVEISDSKCEKKLILSK